jgi:hypothetical protein
MVKKAFVYGSVGVLALGLLVGTAYILLRPVEAQAGELARRGGPGQSGATGSVICDNRQERSETTLGAGGVRWGQSAGQVGAGQGGSGIGQGARREGTESDPAIEADHPMETWISLAGVVTEVGVDTTIETDAGPVVVGLGPDWYREGVSLALSEGDEIVVTGFYEDGEFKAAAIENLSTSAALDLRDQTGRPLWAGRGRNGR